MGVVVDAVSEVLNDRAPRRSRRRPTSASASNTDYMQGVAKVKGTVKILLDLDRVLGADAALVTAACEASVDDHGCGDRDEPVLTDRELRAIVAARVREERHHAARRASGRW